MESPVILLRPCEASDFDALYRIDQACFPPTIAYGRLELKFYLRSKGAYCRVSEVLNEIVGFILTEQIGDTAHIITLDVLDKHRRQNIGSMLLESAEREAALRQARHMVLETATTNKAAIALWKKHGYRQVVTIKNYYGDGQNAYEMHKVLKRSTEEI